MTNILVVEDEVDLREELLNYLKLKGFTAIGAGSCQQAMDLIDAMNLHAAIVDIGLPDGTGLDLVSYIRRKFDYTCGIVMLTAFDDPDYRVNALEDGGDAYLVKRASLREIEATLTSVLRRVPNVDVHDVSSNGWVIDREGWRLQTANGSEVPLTFKELNLLLKISETTPDICRRADLLEVISRDRVQDERSLDTIVRRLRRKVFDKSGEELPVRVAYGVGYGFASQLSLKS